jgi:Lytic transglycolase
VALIALLAGAAVPGSVGSQGPSPVKPIDASLFRAVDAASIQGTAATTPILDPAYRSDGALDHATILLDADERPVPAARPDGERIQPAAPVGSVAIPQWHLDGNVSWYGPGFYGKRTACGQRLTRTLLGVANRRLPCGTQVQVAYRGHTLVVPVIDRGPFAHHAQWDLTSAAANQLGMTVTSRIGAAPLDLALQPPAL